MERKEKEKEKRKRRGVKGDSFVFFSFSGSIEGWVRKNNKMKTHRVLGLRGSKKQQEKQRTNKIKRIKGKPHERKSEE